MSFLVAVHFSFNPFSSYFCHIASLFFPSLNITQHTFPWGFPGGSVIKDPPANEETQVWSLGQEVPLEEVKATHSSILPWEIPWTEEPGELHSMGSQKSWTWLGKHSPGSPERHYHLKAERKGSWQNDVIQIRQSLYSHPWRMWTYQGQGSKKVRSNEAPESYILGEKVSQWEPDREVFIRI